MAYVSEIDVIAGDIHIHSERSRWLKLVEVDVCVHECAAQVEAALMNNGKGVWRNFLVFSMLLVSDKDNLNRSTLYMPV